MALVQVFLNSMQSAIPHEREDLISLLVYMAQQPVETLTDLESASNLMFHLLSHLHEWDFFDEFLKMLHNLKNDFFLVSSPEDANAFKIHVRDKFTFKIILFVSLKYRKRLCVQSEASTAFLHSVLEEILETICVLKPQSLHLLKLMDMLLRKREDVLTPALSVLILEGMNKAAFSPLTGFKNCAHNVSRNVLRSLPHDTKKHLCNFNNLPIKGIDLNDVLKLCEPKDIFNFFDLINRQILKLFCKNTGSRDGGFYYGAIIRICSFDQFVAKIWPYYSNHFRDFDEGEFYQSLLKYWIPITVKQYKADFYVFLTKQNVNLHLKAYTLLETRKRGFYDKSKFNPDTLTFFKYPETSAIALKIICTYTKKYVIPNEFEIQSVRFYISHYSHFEFPDDVLKSLKQFFSHFFLVGHVTSGKPKKIEYGDFLNFVYMFCLFRINDEENCEVSAQLLKIVWGAASGSSFELITPYKIDRENAYGVGANLYYQKLRDSGFWQNTFLSALLTRQIEDLLTQKIKHCPKLIAVVKDNYLGVTNFDNLISLTNLVEELSQSVCLQSSEKIRAYSDLIISYKKLKREPYDDIILKMCDILENKLEVFDRENMFTLVLTLDVLIVIMSYDAIDVMFLLEKSLIFIGKIFRENLNSGFNSKDTKVLESLINNVIECLTLSKTHWSKFNKEQLLTHLCTIIEISNMKRPVSIAANLVNYVGASMETEDKIKLLDRTLNSLYCDKQRGKIRRNPETRLVIHALCLSDKNLTKPFLISSVNFMLEVLANPLSSDSTLSATLHSLEVLVSDNCIHQFTLPFCQDIILHCIRLFGRTNWIVSNANLQLLKSLIERFLGVSLSENVRPKTIEDLFVLFPDLISHFYEILSAAKLKDNTVMVLLFFSESQIKNDFLVRQFLGIDFEKFRLLFADIIKNYSNNVGLLAIKAFTALCPHEKIPDVFAEIVYYIQGRFVQMSKNVFANLVKLLQGLRHKYESALVRNRQFVISRCVASLLKYLKPFDCFYFNLLSVRLYAVDEITNKIEESLNEEIDYKTRIWLNNYVPFVIMEIDLAKLGFFLQRVLSRHVPDFLQVNILSNLVDRISCKNFPVTQVITVLISKLSKLSDCNKFLITAYSKSILLLYEFTCDLNLPSDTIVEIRQDFQTDSIYKVFIYVLALAHYDFKCENDEIFLSLCVRKYFDSLGDDDILVDLSVTIIHLYKCVSVNDRYNVIKLIFYLLLNDSTYFEICKFMSWLTKSQCSSILISLVRLLNCANLTSYVGDKRLAFKLLLEFYCYVDLPELEESDTYYLIENDCPLPRHCVKAVILKSLSDCNSN